MREALLKVRELRAMHGLSERDVPALPLRDVAPADVRQFVDAVLADIRELQPALGVSAPEAQASMRSGKTPTDVFAHLRQASLQLDALDETDIRPFHVYRVALTVTHELDDIWDHVGLTGETHLVTHHGLGL